MIGGFVGAGKTTAGEAGMLNRHVAWACLALPLLGPVARAADETAPPNPFRAERFREHVGWLASDALEGRGLDSPGLAKAASYVVRHFREFGFEPLGDDATYFQSFDSGADGKRGRNLLAVLPGRGPLAEECVIVSAHPDHLGMRQPQGPQDDVIFNGADDNASGVAVMLLMAERLADQRAQLPPSHRAVVFAAFDAEESGLAGSRYYVEHPMRALQQTAAVLNFDMVGRLQHGKLYAADAQTSPVLARALEELARECGLVVETRFGGARRSDHAPFLDRRIPGVHFNTGIHPDYHHVSDHTEKLNHQGAARVAWLGYRVLRTAIEHPEPLAYRDPDPAFDVLHALRFVRQLGIIPNVNAQQGRYPQILLVVPGSQASEHGIRAGDQVTALNGLKFTRAEDGLAIFSQLTFDEGLRLSLLRAQEQVEVVIPASVFEGMLGPVPKPLDDGTYEVEFTFAAPPGTKTVYLAGTFNEWKPTARAMQPSDQDGVFRTRLVLEAGVYEYKFVIDAMHWHADPQNLHQSGRHGNSVLWVGKKQ